MATCACEVRDGKLINVCALHAQYARDVVASVDQLRNSPEYSKAPSHSLGRAATNVGERIRECETVVNDLDMLWQELHFQHRKLTNDDMINILMGMNRLYGLRFERLRDEFEGFVREVHS